MSARNLVIPLVLLALLPFARGDDETPAARTKRVAAAFPAPSKDRGFAWDLEIVVGTSAAGTIRVVAQPGGDPAAGTWAVTEHGERPGLVTDATVDVGRDLMARSGMKRATKGETLRSATFRRTEKGYALSTLDPEAPDGPKAADFEAADGAWAGFGTLLLFCRLVPAEKATYGGMLLDALPEADDETLVAATVTVVGEETWTWEGTSAPAWGVSAERGRRRIHLAFVPGTRELLGARFVGTPAVILPKGVAKPPPGVDFSKPATSAKLAAAKAWLGIMTGDRALVEAAFHWRSAYEAENAGADDPLVTETAFRQMFLEALKKRTERAALEPVLVGYLADATAEEQEDGTTKVVFPDKERIPAFRTREIGGVWYVVALP